MAKGAYKSVFLEGDAKYSPPAGKREMLVSVAFWRKRYSQSVELVYFEVTETATAGRGLAPAFKIQLGFAGLRSGFYFADQIPRVEPLKLVLEDAWQVGLYGGKAYLTLLEMN